MRHKKFSKIFSRKLALSVFLMLSLFLTTHAFAANTSARPSIAGLMSAFQNFITHPKPVVATQTAATAVSQNSTLPSIGLSNTPTASGTLNTSRTITIASTPSDSALTAALQRLLARPDIAAQLRGPQGPAGPAGSSSFVTSSPSPSPNPVRYLPVGITYPDPSHNFSGGIYSNIANLSSNLFTTNTANVTDITVAGTSTTKNLSVTGNSTLAGTLNVIGTISGSATINADSIIIKAGTATVAPIQLASGVNLTTPVAGAMEWDGTRLFITDSTPTRKTIAYNPLTTIGDISYGGVNGVETRLPGNNATDIRFLSQVGDGVNAGAPAWVPIPVAGELTFFYTDPASDVPGYHQMPSIANYTPATKASITAVNPGDGGVVGSFATNTGFPNLTFIPDGLFDIHIHAKETGVATATVRAELYKRSAGGVETLLVTTENGPVLTSSESEFDLGASTSLGFNLLATDRLVIKFIAVVSSGTPDITIFYDGTGANQTNARLELPTAAADVSSFVPYTGATQNVNLGTHTLTTPTVIGGSGVTDILSLKGTTGNGTLTSPAIQALVGNNGATNALTILNNGNVGIGTNTPSSGLTVNGTVFQYSDSSRTAVVASTTLGTSPYSFAISGRYAYVENAGSNSLSTVDISNPNAPFQVATTSVGSSPSFGVAVSGKYAYVSNNTASVSVVDISNSAAPIQVATITLPSSTRGIGVSGHYLFVDNFTGSKLYVFDIANPLAPVQVAAMPTNGRPWYMKIVGRYLYTANSIDGSLVNRLLVVDISNPTAPFIAGSASVGTLPMGVAVSGRYAYVANQGSGTLSVVDVSNPTAPLEVASTTVAGGFAFDQQITLSGRNLYVNAGNNILVYDISNPTTLRQTASIDLGSTVIASTVSGRYLYATNATSFVVIDLGGVDAGTLAAGSVEAGNVQSLNDVIAQGSVQAGSLFIGSGGISSSGALAVSATSSPSYFGGSLGIGNTSPVSLLTIAAGTPTTAANGLNFGTDVAANLYRSAASTIKTDGNLVVAGHATLEGVTSTGATGTGVLVFGTAPTFTTSATVPLLIGGTTTTSPLTLRSTSGAGTTGADIIFQTGTNGGTEAMRILNSGNVGIGTTSPTAKLEAYGTDDLVNNALGVELGVYDTQNMAAGAGGIIGLGGKVNSTGYMTYGGIGGLKENNTTDDTSGYLAFFTRRNTLPLTVERMRIDSLGNVGIGTSNPLTKLTVLDTVGTSPRGILSMQISDDTNGARLGFSKARGTPTTPTTVLSGDVLGRLMFRGYDGTNYLEMASIEVGASGTVASTRVPTFLAFSTATDAAPSVLTERMRIDNAGLVGIGTPTPNAILHVSGTSARAMAVTDGSANDVLTVDSTNTAVSSGIDITAGGSQADNLLNIKSSGGTILSNFNASGALTINVGSTTALDVQNGSGVDAFVVDSVAGNVGIGLTAPLTKLTVADTSTSSPRGILSMQFSDTTDGARVGFAKARGTVAAPTTILTGDILGRLMFRGYDGTNYLEMASIEVGASGTVASTRVPTFIAFSTATDAAPSVLTEAMRINSSGFVGVGCADPDHLLELGGTGAGCNTGTGSFISAGATAFTANSSQEWKQNIQTYDMPDILTRIVNTPARTFDWKPEFCTGVDCTNNLGFIAQEFYGVLGRGDNLHVNGQDIMIAEWLAIQHLELNLEGVAGTTVPLPGSPEETFMRSFFAGVFNKITAWLADTTNGVTSVFANVFNAKEKICVDGECLTKTDVHDLLLLAHPNLGTGGALNTPTCTATQTLVNGVCTNPTPADPVCTATQTLVNGVCTDPAPATPACTATQTLVDGVCTDPAPVVPTCTATQTLVNNVCTDPAPATPSTP